MTDATCWTMIRDAAAGDRSAREWFARLYLPAVRAYLGARWRDWSGPEGIEDAVQEVFLECIRDRGVLERAQRGNGAGFRAYLYGAVRNVARRLEERRVTRPDSPRSRSFHPEDVRADERSLSRAFDRAWAESMLRDARTRQAERARAAGPEAERRLELLRLHFAEGLAIAEIARRWGLEAKRLQRDYRRALDDFHVALREVVALHRPDQPERVERECRELLALVD